MSALELQRFGACLILALSASALRLRLPLIPWQFPAATILLQFAALTLPWHEAAVIAIANAVGFAVSQKQGRLRTIMIAATRASVVMMAWALIRLSGTPLPIVAQIIVVGVTFLATDMYDTKSWRNGAAVWYVAFAALARAAVMIDSVFGWQALLVGGETLILAVYAHRVYQSRLIAETARLEAAARSHKETLDILAQASTGKRRGDVWGLGIAREIHMPADWRVPENNVQRFERWDGSGRPHGLAGAAIPIEARIAAIAEFVGARSHLAAKDLVTEMIESSGTVFDPRLIEIVANNYVAWEGSFDSNTPSPSVQVSAMRTAQRQADAWSGLAKSLNSAMTVSEVSQALTRHLPGLVAHHSMALWLKSSEGYRLVHGDQGSSVPVGSEWIAGSRAELVLDTGQTELGILALDGITDNPDLSLMRHTAKRIAAALEIAIKYEAAERSASIDPLTNIPNSRSLYRRLARELSQSKRTNSPFSVLVADLDGFKDINDRYGHLRGNELLADIAKALHNACREYDFVARLSGDEFVLILPGAGFEVSERRAVALRKVIESAANHLIPDCGVTASIGVAAFPADGVEAHELLAKADRAMYEQKAARPRVRPFLASGRIWPHSTPLPKPLIN